MIGSDVVREYEALGGVSFFRVVLLEDENLKEVTKAFEVTAEQYNHLRFAVTGFDGPTNALNFLRQRADKGERVHLLIIDHDLSRSPEPGWDGVQFLQAAWSIHPEAFFVFRTAYLPSAWEKCGDVARSAVGFRKGLIDRQVAPFVKGASSDKEIIGHFLEKFRALILERRRRPARLLVVTDCRNRLGGPELKFSDGNAWFLKPVEVAGGVWFTDDSIPPLTGDFEDALVVFVVSGKHPMITKPIDGGIPKERQSSPFKTYMARRHFRSVWLCRKERNSNVQIEPAKLPTWSSGVNVYSTCFNMNLLWLNERRRGYRPIVSERLPGSSQTTYRLESKPEDLFFQRLKTRGGRDLCNRFNALAHLYEHFNADGFFQDSSGRLAGLGEVKACASNEDRQGLGMSPDVKVYLYTKSDGSPRLLY
jgi:hypothetical protein